MPFRSPDYAVVRFNGPDAASFLQSQLTNDVSALAIGQWQWQGYCSSKGRLLATFALARSATDCFEAVTPASTAVALVKRLTLYRLRSKLTIEAVTDKAVALCFSGEAPASGFALALPDGRQFVIVDPDHASALPDADDAVRQRWALANIDARQPEVTAATAELFVPQMIDWDRVAPGGGVSFSKGCYPGQEVVARAHYRGAVKRHLERVTLDAAPAAASGHDITLSDGRVATLCNVVPDPRRPQLRALVVTVAPESS